MTAIGKLALILVLASHAALPVRAQPTPADAGQLAAAVVNDYVRLCSQPVFTDESRGEWVATDERLAAEFRKLYHQLRKAAWKRDPEMGWGADPILDAQDVPEGRYRPGEVTRSEADEVRGVLVLAEPGWKPLPFVAKRIDGVWKIASLGSIQ